MRHTLAWAAGMMSFTMLTGVALAEELADKADAKAKSMLIRDLKKLDEGEVFGSDGQKVGHIDGIAIDASTGRIAYAVIEFDKMADIGDKKFAVPWKAIKKQAGDDRETLKLSLNVDRERLNRAKGIEGDKWPSLTDASMREMHSQWQVDPDAADDGARVTVRTDGADVDVRAGDARIQGQPVSPTSGAVVCRADDIVGHDIVDQNNQKIAELHTVMVDAHSGRLLLGIVEPDKAPDLAKDFLHPVPFQMLKVSRAGDRAGAAVRPGADSDENRQRTQDRSDLNLSIGDSSDGAADGGILRGEDSFRITLAQSFDKVKNGPKFGEREWPEMDHKYVQSVYQAYGVEMSK